MEKMENNQTSSAKGKDLTQLLETLKTQMPDTMSDQMKEFLITLWLLVMSY